MLLVRLAILPALAATLPQPLQADLIDDYVRRQMEADRVPGAAFAVIRPDNSVDARAYGLANLESGEPFTTKTVFRIASLSKQFCAYATLLLEAQGKLSLQDPIHRFFPDLPESWRPITVKDLLGHRSGIADPGEEFDFARQYTAAEYFALVTKRPLAENPGQTFRYNNHGYATLGLVVGAAANSTLREVVKQNVFDPVGMKDTRYFDFEEIVPRRALAYRLRNGQYINALNLRPRIFDGSGGILSTIDDLVQYELALRGAKPGLDPKIVRQKWTPVFAGASGYGGGWRVLPAEKNQTPTVRHSGSTFGFTSQFVREKETGYTILLFRNSAGGDDDKWADDLLNLAKNPSSTPSP